MGDEILKIEQSGLQTADERVQALMENVVNARTPGFIKSDIVSKSFPVQLQMAADRLDGNNPMQPVVEGKYYSQIKGTLNRTGRELDLACPNDGFFVISGSWGEGYTRDGRLLVTNQGQLVTVAGGYPILGKSGEIQVTPGAKLQITKNGKVMEGDTEIAQLRQVRITDLNKLETLNGVIFKSNASNPAQEIDAPEVLSGYLEAANFNVVDAMMQMTHLNQVYNMNTNLVRSRDSNLTKALEMGKMQ